MGRTLEVKAIQWARLKLKSCGQRQHLGGSWEGKGSGTPRSAKDWDVLSHSLSPPSFWVCLPSSEPTPFTFIESSLPKEG